MSKRMRGGKYLDWEPPIKEKNIYCPFCGEKMKLIEEDGARGLWMCDEHGGWDSYHPYPRWSMEKWPKRSR